MFALTVCASVLAQSREEAPRVHLLPQTERSVPFTLDQKGQPPVSLRSSDQMSRNDQDLLANAESTIREKAGFEGLDFGEAGWSFQQIVCPALPNHLLLRFSRDDGSRQMSMFSAAIPRGSEGKIRIVPIVRRGYSLLSPAPINSLTVSAFNHIRAEEAFERPPDWVGTGLCYAALTGGDPDPANAAPRQSDDPTIPAGMAPILDSRADGSAAIRFIARGANGKPMLWTMHFDRKGVLLKAQHEPATLIVVRPAPDVISDPLQANKVPKKAGPR